MYRVVLGMVLGTSVMVHRCAVGLEVCGGVQRPPVTDEGAGAVHEA